MIVVLVGVLAIAGGLIFQGNVTNNTSNTSVANQSNNLTNNGVTNNSFNSSNGNNDTTSNDTENTTDEQPHSDVAYRISSNTPDCPNCGSNNIAQIGETLIDPNTDEWVAFSRCLYCGYEWEYRVSRGAYN